MHPMTTENPPLANPLDANCFGTDRHTASLLDMDRHNAACLDAVLCDADPHSVCCHNADLCTNVLRGADLRNADHHNASHRNADRHNASHCNAESFELLLERILSEGDNQAMETGVSDFEASKTGEENRSVHEKRNPVSRKFAAAECFARPQSERN
jgi:uncharacterized protein YjbI with pentapeptide repeats